MACERCGGNGGGSLSGTKCPACGMGGKGRSGKFLLAGGVALTVLALAVSVVTLYGGGDTESAGADGADASGGSPGGDVGGLGGTPQRIVPTALPPAASVSASASGSGSASASPTGPGSPSPSASGSRGTTATPKPPGSRGQGAAYSAWAGPGCSGGGVYAERGRYGDGNDGWYTVNSGGRRGDGCDGRFTAIPMSGSATKDGGGTATWSWYLGSGYTSCSVSVVVPESNRARDVAGKPTTYHILTGDDAGASAIRSFEVDQTALRGSGVIVEKIPVFNQQLSVRLVDRGVDRGSAEREGAHHAAAQMRADCRA
ncbi:adhesin [Streptomyces sp. NPDC052236]|uniref:adhesin n=1 Tax=Streptomyces sp. NPDC052236 TaxID=3365686 RepID=UPI0037CEE336